MSSILSTVPFYVLSNSLALNRLLAEAGRTVDWKLWAYAAFTQRDATRPDHVFMKRWERFETEGGYQPKEKIVDLLEAIRLIAEGYLEISNGRLYVKNQGEEPEEERVCQAGGTEMKYGKSAHFDRWQNIRARMTTWPMKLYMLYRHHCPADYFLAHPLEPMMADFIRQEGLNETHLHLNGCFYPEEEWLTDMYDIHGFLNETTQKWQDVRFHEHYVNVNPCLSPLLVANRLKLAALLRDAVLQLLDWSDRGCPLIEIPNEEREDESAKTTPWQEHLIRNTFRHIRRYALNPSLFSLPAWAVHVPKELRTRKQQEMQMWMRAFRLLEKGSEFRYKGQLQFFLHLYLLLENEHIQLNYHTEPRKGFEAFSISNDHTKRGVGSAEYYEETFYRLLKTAETKSHNYIEVRVAPKNLRTKCDLYLRSYEKACRRWEQEQKEQLRMQGELPPQSILRPQLVLVVHMIKNLPEKAPTKNQLLISPLFDSERKKHMKEAAELAEVARYLMTQHRVPMAIDAANSELNQAPEVFAPAYRLFERESGISHKTYHCGEDFLHLISGIRAVYEAITFLNLRNGNRIGHGIAVGISSKTWVESMPAKLVVSKRDWLLDMIFVWKLLHEHNPAAAEKAEREAVRVAGLLFAADARAVAKAELQYNSIHNLANFFKMRQFEPSYVSEWLDGRLPISHVQDEEWKLLDEKKKQFGIIPAVLYLCWNYSPWCRRAQEDLIEVKTDFLTKAELLELQQRVQHLIAVRDVVIETLPVSNVRISQYRRMQEHHVLRWLKVKGYTEEGDADMNICMGSDDPGIFATDLKNEYYHLYMCLRNAGLSAHEALEKLRRVNNAGRQFAFRKLPDMQPTPFKLTSLLNNSPRPLTLWERVERYSKHREQEGGDPYRPDWRDRDF